jgi:FlaA1/EpsC-like NDP-sugar epimerase
VLNNKTILITGGTGSFGKKFSSIVLNKFKDVRKKIIYSSNEYKQFPMQNMPEFQSYLKKMRFFIGDVRDKDRLKMAFNGVDFVVHAAALKQVPSCEYNPFEAIKTNVIGAQNIIEAALSTKVKRVVALSTDKACAPVKRMRGGELYVKKIPSMKITELARAIAPDVKLKEVGIRPGEKIHEEMITEEDARNTLEFKDYFVVLPDAGGCNVDHSHANCSPVAENFEYNSGNNDRWLTIGEMEKLIEEIE